MTRVDALMEVAVTVAGGCTSEPDAMSSKQLAKPAERSAIFFDAN